MFVFGVDRSETRGSDSVGFPHSPARNNTPINERQKALRRKPFRKIGHTKESSSDRPFRMVSNDSRNSRGTPVVPDPDRLGSPYVVRELEEVLDDQFVPVIFMFVVHGGVAVPF